MTETYHLALVPHPLGGQAPHMLTVPAFFRPEFAGCSDLGPGTYARYSRTFVAGGRVYRLLPDGFRLAEVGPLPERGATWRNRKTGREAAVVSVLACELRMHVVFQYRTPNPKTICLGDSNKLYPWTRNAGLADFVEKFALVGG